MHTGTPQRQMSTEEYLRTEVFGEARKKEQKRRDNVERFVDRPMTMQEYVKYAVYGEDLPDELTAEKFRKKSSAAVRETNAMRQRGSTPQIPLRNGVAFGNAPAGRHVGSGKLAASSGLGVGVGQGRGLSPLQLAMQHDARGRIARKVEAAGTRQEYAYAYDPKGRLEQVWRNGAASEQYAYNEQGQRVRDVTLWRGARELVYDAAGRLVQAGDTIYEYSPEGALQRRVQRVGSGEGGLVTQFAYGADTLLDAVLLPDGTQITYQYGAARGPLGPREKYVNGVLTESYLWRDATRLSAWIDHQRGVRCLFHYEAGGSPVAVTVEHEQGAATCQLGFDQVGTLKLVSTPDGKLIKEMTYDSFGNMIANSNPEFFLPLGFASGLVDRHTGLVRFGYRDYDPTIGRFTALDPARDMRGDGDLWDYCVDDPINSVDPLGLFRFGVRTLDGLRSSSGQRSAPMPDGSVANGWINGMEPSGNYNLHLHHEQGFYEDEKGGDIGFGKDGAMNDETGRKGEYRMLPEVYDDNIMRESAQITSKGKYGVTSNNCQDYADRMRENYDLLKDSPEIRSQIEQKVNLK